MNSVALLLGLFVMPVVLLWTGHNFKHRTVRQRRLFWGMTVGYGVAVLGVSLTLVLDPVLWPESGSLRTWITFWGLLAGGVLGGVLGVLWPSSEKE